MLEEIENCWIMCRIGNWNFFGYLRKNSNGEICDYRIEDLIGNEVYTILSFNTEDVLLVKDIFVIVLKTITD